MLSLLVFATTALASPPQTEVSIMSGAGEARYRLPADVGDVPSYVNTGFQQRRDGDSLIVHVDIATNDWTRAPFGLRKIEPSDEPIARFARRAVAGATTRAEAVSRLLHAIAAHTTFRIGDDVPTAPDEVLTRREAHCVGRSNLAVAALATLQIRARPARGLLLETNTGRAVPHRWIEVFYPDAGWVFSDPTESINYVSPLHVVLTPPEAPDPEYRPGGRPPPRLEHHSDRLVAIDLRPARYSPLAERRLGVTQYAGAIVGQVVPPTAGRLTLIGRGTRRTLAIRAGRPFAFPGLEPGAYTLESEFDGESRTQTVRVADAELIHVEVTAP